MSVLCLDVCRLCVPNIMSLSACLKKLHLVKFGAFVPFVPDTPVQRQIRVILGVRFERRKVDTTANLHEN